MTVTVTAEAPAAAPEAECAECGETSADAMTCEGRTGCTARGCSCVVALRSFACGGWGDGLYLCDDCTPDHRGHRACE